MYTVTAEHTTAIAVLVGDGWGLGEGGNLPIAPIAYSYNLVLFKWDIARGLEGCWQRFVTVSDDSEMVWAIS